MGSVFLTLILFTNIPTSPEFSSRTGLEESVPLQIGGGGAGGALCNQFWSVKCDQ